MDGAMFEVQWFSVAPLKVLVGSCTVTESRIEITGLEADKQYWANVRAVRVVSMAPDTIGR
jgi:hypothetical protein